MEQTSSWKTSFPFNFCTFRKKGIRSLDLFCPPQLHGHIARTELQVKISTGHVKLQVYKHISVLCTSKNKSASLCQDLDYTCKLIPKSKRTFQKISCEYFEFQNFSFFSNFEANFSRKLTILDFSDLLNITIMSNIPIRGIVKGNTTVRVPFLFRLSLTFFSAIFEIFGTYFGRFFLAISDFFSAIVDIFRIYFGRFLCHF